MDKAATIKNAMPASHVLPVNSQTTNAIKAAGINMKSKRITSIINMPITINAIIPRISANNIFPPFSTLKTEFGRYKFMHKSKKVDYNYYLGA